MVTTLIFVRHAEAQGNKDRIFHGWTDSDLTEKGHMQAKAVAQRLNEQKIDVVYSSTLKRAWKTAQYIAVAKGMTVIKSDKLKEINGGDWEGVEFSRLSEKWPVEFYTWECELNNHKMPNGEDIIQFRDRLVEEIDSIVHNNLGKTICIATHGTAIRVLLSHFYGSLDAINSVLWCENTAISIVEVDNNGYKVVVESDSSHLSEELYSSFMHKLHLPSTECNDFSLEKGKLQ